MSESRSPRDTPVAFDPLNGRLRRGSSILALRPKDAAVLQELAERPGQLISKALLIRTAWPGISVTEGVLKACINRLRAALGDDAETPRYIETVHRLGYRLIGDLPLTDEATLNGGLSPARAGQGAQAVVGRSRELAQLDGALSDAIAGRGRTVFISGEAGMGKTALLELFLRTRIPSDMALARGQCIEHYGAGEAYMPLFEALRSLCGRDAAWGEVTGELAEHAPSWVAQMPGVLPAPQLDAIRERTAGTTRERMLREFAHAMAALAARRPIVLAVEDLHWTDVSTLDALAVLARRAEHSRLLLVGTYRPEERLAREHPLLAFARDLRMHRYSAELALSSLGREAVDAYLTMRLPGCALSDDLRRAVYDRTEGHPLFLCGLVDLWLGNQWIRRGAGGWALAADPGLLLSKTPDDFRQMVDARLDRLSLDEREAIEAASVSGQSFVAASVAAALGAEPVDVDERLSAIARQRRLLTEDGEEGWPDGTRSGRYRFAHARYAHVVYEGVPAARRQQMHRRIARREEAGLGGGRLAFAARLARHFEAAGEYAAAVRYRTAAAQNALSVGGFCETIAHASAAVDLLRAIDDRLAAELELPVQILLGSARAATEGFASTAAERAYARARELTTRAPDTNQSVQVLAGLYAYHLMRGPASTTGEIADRLFNQAQRNGGQDGILWGRMARGVQRLQCGDLLAAREELEAVVSGYEPARGSAYRAIHPVDPAIAALGYLSWTLWTLGFEAEALARGDEAIALAEEHANPVDTAHALVLQAHLHQFSGNATEALRCARRATSMCEEFGLGQYLSPAGVVSGWARAMTGELAEGLAGLRLAIHGWERTGAQYSQPRHWMLLAEVLGRAGELTAAGDSLSSALQVADATGERFWEPEIHRLRAEILLLGQPRQRARRDANALEQARAHVVCAINLARTQHARPLLARAEHTRRKIETLAS